MATLRDKSTYIWQLGMPVVFPTLQDGMNAIHGLKPQYCKNHFDGAFVEVVASCFIYEFHKTLPASSADLASFPVIIKSCAVHEVVPDCANSIHFDVDIVAISMRFIVETEEKGMEKGIQRAKPIMEKYMAEAEPVVKRIKLDLEAESFPNEIYASFLNVIPVL